MTALADSPAPHPDRTFSIALGLILLFAAVEVLAVLFHFGAKMRAERAASRRVTAHAPAAPASATPVPGAASAVPASATPSSAALSASDRLLDEAQALNERGDTANALARLQEASQRDPRNPQVLAEMATIYESIQLYDRSNETWRKIQDIGPSAGTLYELAEMKLKTGVAALAPRATPAEASGAALDREGLPADAVFGISDIMEEHVPDPDAETNLRLKITVKKREGVPIELAKLKIIVRFYDLLDNERVADTDADVSFEWFNQKHDWSEANPETLIVNYVRPKNHAVTSEAALSAAAAAVTPGKMTRTKKRAESGTSTEGSPSEPGRRKYFGYVVRIFYDDKLQTVRAEPSRLLTDAPTPASP
jgi:tetratricopeptide (TPR) repeat protein